MKRILPYLPWLLMTSIGFGQSYNYLGSYDGEGTPDYLTTPDVVSASTLQLISEALPEGFPVPEYNPHYISSGYDTDVILYEDAEVWVTFVGEGAGYKNVLGFYTYPAGQPPASAPAPEDITIIFPNVSAVGSGGGLRVGDKVRIGQFSEGTAIGWVLFANGWRGQVTGGHWQVYSRPEYNPEPQPELQFHNVLLSDSENERIILGFEDIRRDYGSCDNDFNDALFYITASPYTALKTSNLVKVEDRNPVTSANDGGLESNGRLAERIAARKLERRKSGNARNLQVQQEIFTPKNFRADAKSGTLNRYFPDTGMLGTEEARISSPEDLLQITNAAEVFSVDFYQEGERVSAALATHTRNGVYNHTKYICDRLNDAELTDVRRVTLQGHSMVYSRLERATGTEHALAFSVLERNGEFELYSTWNLADYPAGDYLNFQVWGSSMGQVSTLVNHILWTLSEQKDLISGAAPRIPEVFVRKGSYRDGRLQLQIANPERATQVTFRGKLKRTEQSDLESFQYTASLSGASTEWVEVPTGYLFDIGIEMTSERDSAADDLYLADGPWGVDYDPAVDAAPEWQVLAHSDTLEVPEGYLLERGLSMEGQVKGTINVFRHILAGDRSLDTQDFRFLSLDIHQDRPVEISLVIEGMTDWNDRLRFTLEPDSIPIRREIALADFRDGSGKTREIKGLTSIVFSVQGDYQEASNFKLELARVLLSRDATESAAGEVADEDSIQDAEEVDPEEFIAPQTKEELEAAAREKAYNELKELTAYPNPFESSLQLILPEPAAELYVAIRNISGRVVWKRMLQSTRDGRTFLLEVPGLPSGLYLYLAVDTSNGQRYEGKIIRK